VLVVNIIGSFSDVLIRHLGKEIASIVALGDHEPLIPVLKLWMGVGEGEGMGMGMGEKWAEMRHCLFYMYHHDKSFEAPLWEGFQR
jgi:hypothetical protein